MQKISSEERAPEKQEDVVWQEAFNFNYFFLDILFVLILSLCTTDSA